MKTTCEEMRDWIPRALMSDLTPAEDRLLNPTWLSVLPAQASSGSISIP